jgi:hypothetical protein
VYLPTYPWTNNKQKPWLSQVSIIPATQEAEIRRIEFPSQPRQMAHHDTLSEKTLHKKGLVEWLKV